MVAGSPDAHKRARDAKGLLHGLGGPSRVNDIVYDDGLVAKGEMMLSCMVIMISARGWIFWRTGVLPAGGRGASLDRP